MMNQTGLRKEQSSFDILKLADGWSIAGTITYAINHVAHGQPIVLLGAFGLRAEGGGGGKVKATLGSIAEEVLQRSKAPVLLVRKGDPNLGLPPRDLVALRRHNKVDAKHRLDLCVCVDGSAASRVAYDMGLSLCRAGDVMRVVHVRDTSVGRQGSFKDHSNTRDYYGPECAKEDFAFPAIDISYVELPKGNSIKEALQKYLASSSCSL
eukprot:3928360-Prymnesium_polylepis.2